MNAAELKSRVLVPLAAAAPSLDAGRIRLAYEDVSSFARTHQELAERCEGKDLAELTQTGRAEEARQYVLDSQARGAQLKALYGAADVFCSVLLNEARGRPPQWMTVMRFAERSPKARAMDPEVLLDAYCVSAYRHRVVVHREAPRMMTFCSAPGDGLRLVPVIGPSQLSPEDEATLTHLGSRDVSALFHRVPVLGREGQLSPDRTAIDALAARHGCRSMTASQVVAAVGAFSLAVAELGAIP